MKIKYATYTLHPRAALGSHAGASGRDGALLCVEEESQTRGYADLHPWPELGDLTCKEQLARLKRGEKTPQVELSLKFAASDARARFAGRSLFAGLDIPKSHYLITDLISFGKQQLNVLIAGGFSHIKAKIGRRPDEEVAAIERIDKQLNSEIKWRLDANANLTFQAVAEMLDTVRLQLGADRFYRMFDFIEDPCPYSAAKWHELHDRFDIGIAVDREIDKLNDLKSVSHVVIKPAVQDYLSVAKCAADAGKRIVVTSYLDHPVGQLHAACAAGTLRHRFGSMVDIGGLLSSGAYRSTSYSEALRVRECRLESPGGLGIGFKHLLDGEKWIPLE